MDTVLEVLKWVLLVFIVGFIGQFGKSLSAQVIEYFRKRKKQELPGAPANSHSTGQDILLPLTENTPQSETDKKALKAQQKLQKKAAKGKNGNFLK